MTLTKAMNRLKDQGYQMTKRRKDILTFFYEAKGYRTAKALNEHLESYYQGISFDTIYRNLHLFTKLGILEETELQGEKHFRMATVGSHAHHFICNDCGDTKDIKVCPMGEVENLLKNYQINDHKFEIYGLCPQCRSA